VSVSKYISSVAVAALLLLPVATYAEEHSHEEPKDPIVAYRTNVMRSIGANAADLGAILARKVDYDENIALHAEAMSLGAKAALKAFATKQPGGTAKPDIWNNWKDFSDRLVTLDNAAADIAKSAREGGATAAGPKVAALFRSGICKDCHDKYRTK
jgi:cytochrome c556